MSYVPTESTADTDWPEGEPQGEPVTLQPGMHLGRFLIEDFVGHGGMGVVYQATHLSTQARVALKTLHRVNARAEARLKSEFRSLAEVRDEHLVQLYELHTIEGRCFLTMEFIDGEILADHLRARDRSAAPCLPVVRDRFVQIARGLMALHREGLLHLDLKPDNVMVDRNGRVKILDFGLVAPLGAEASTPGRKSRGGTVRYMPPERRANAAPDAAADWYALGVMLTEILAPAWSGPGTDPRFPVGTPEDLASLCVALLSTKKETRPSGAAVLRALGAEDEVPPSVRARSERRLRIGTSRLIGRELELDRLRDAARFTHEGGTMWLEISGESGVGKTALIRHFEEEVLKASDVVMFRGACRDRESVPFQGMEEIMDGLAGYLAQSTKALDDGTRDTMWTAGQLFVAFADACQPYSGAQPPDDPVIKRRQAFSAIRALLESVTRSRPVVLLIDDIQWGDGDGARLLAELLASPSPQRLLVLTTSQAGSPGEASFAREIDTLLEVRGTSAQRSSLHLGRLTDEQVRLCLMSRATSRASEHTENIVHAAGGLPFLAEALGTHAWSADETPTLEGLVDRRLARAPEGSLEVLRAVALSPAPLPQSVALGLISEPNQRLAALSALRHAELVRTSNADQDGPLEPYHSLISSTVKGAMSLDARRRVRLEVAEALEVSGLGRAEHLASLFHLAGEISRAAPLAPIAAREAEAALAFESAAHWYRRAAEWTPQSAADLLPRQARCLEYAGRSAEAGRVYERSAELDPTRRVLYTRAAGAAFLNAGHVDRGLSTLAPELEELGAPVSKSEKTAIGRCVRLLWRLWRRGVDFEPRRADECSAKEMDRIDAIWNAGKGIGVVMPLRGLALQLDCAHAALDAREVQRACRSLALLGPMLMGSPLEKLGRKWQERAHALAATDADDYLRGALATFDALAMCARWDPPADIVTKASEGLRLLKLSGQPCHWEQTAALGFVLRASELGANFHPLRKEAVGWLSESTDRGDLFGQTLANHARAMHLLADGDAEGAVRSARASVARWTHETFTVQHYYALRYEIQGRIYQGNLGAALDAFDKNWSAMTQAQLLRNPISRPELLLLRATIELLRSSGGGLRHAARIAKRLARENTRVGAAHAETVMAACHSEEGRTSATRQHLMRAIELYKAARMTLHECCATIMLGHVEGETSDVRRAHQTLQRGGIADPEEFAGIHLPRVRTPRNSRLMATG